MKPLWALSIASLKMYLRQREVLIWAFFFPLLLVSMFGFVNFDGTTTITLGIVNEAGPGGKELLSELSAVSGLDIHEGTMEDERNALLKGERDLVMHLDGDYTADDLHSVKVLADREAKPRETQLGVLVLERVLDDLALRHAGHGARRPLVVEPVVTRNLTYVDYLLPGVLSMTIMQLGVFGVAFGFVSLKRRGVLRRLRATPLRPRDFILAQVSSRMVVLLAQMAVMLTFGVLVLHLHFLGNPLLILIFGILGAAVFLGIGFAIAGIARSEDQVPPLANIVSIPMILLSGIFFSRDHLPGFVRVVTEYLPLTYLADGMRAVVVDGAGFHQSMPQLIGLMVWAPLSAAAAVWLFRWE